MKKIISLIKVLAIALVTLSVLIACTTRYDVNYINKRLSEITTFDEYLEIIEIYDDAILVSKDETTITKEDDKYKVVNKYKILSVDFTSDNEYNETEEEKIIDKISPLTIKFKDDDFKTLEITEKKLIGVIKADKAIDIFDLSNVNLTDVNISIIFSSTTKIELTYKMNTFDVIVKMEYKNRIVE